jgi:hypothetical protein
MSKKYGSLITNDCVINAHEWNTINFLLSKGFDVELIPRSLTEGIHSPDILLDHSIYWEIKAPKGSGKNTMSNNFIRAKKQSKNIIIDLARYGKPDAVGIREAKSQFRQRKRFEKLKIITKNREIIDEEK